MTSPLAGKPSWRWMLSHPAHVVSCGFGAGLSPKAPGTVGSLLAWALYYPLHGLLGNVTMALLLALAFLGGIAIVSRTGKALGVVDHGGIVWDECVAVWCVLLCLPQQLIWHVLGVTLFRVFDITKPPPIRQFEARFKNGFGVMADDLLAAALTLLVLQLGLGRVWP